MQAPDGPVDRLISEPAAMVSGSAAWLLSRLLRSPSVVKVLTNAPDRADIAATVDAIHAAGRAHANRPEQERRDNATAPGAVAAQSAADWSTGQAADYLQISRRRAQELASELDGEKIGRAWRIPASAVRAYQRQKAERAA
jgi:excisionase family DNA binding protein